MEEKQNTICLALRFEPRCCHPEILALIIQLLEQSGQNGCEGLSLPADEILSQGSSQHTTLFVLLSSFFMGLHVKWSGGAHLKFLSKLGIGSEGLSWVLVLGKI